MILAGLQKSSLIDYPGKVSCVVFLSGCNMACPFCHNPDLARGRYPQHIELSRFWEFLEPRSAFFDGVVVSGGEPTLAPDLDEFCKGVHALGLPVKLDTNGGCPEVLERLIAGRLIDYIAMDIKAPLEHYPELGGARIGGRVAQSIPLVMQSGLDYEFRTTCVRPFVDHHRIGAIAGAVQGARRYILQNFRPGVLLNPSFGSGSDAGFNPQEMEDLRRAAAPWVQTCLLRGEPAAPAGAGHQPSDSDGPSQFSLGAV